jgi:hypothetical protein
MSKRVLVACAILCVAGYVFVYATGRASPPIRSDGYSYYVYLPAWFIYGDPSLRAVARDCCGGEFPAFTAITRWPGTRRWVNAHPMGVAVLQSPFFLVAHALTKWSNLSPDGFTLYYQHAAGLAGTFWTLAGLVVLRRLLRRHFSDGVTAATLVALLFGTGLYHYATYDSSYSHAYSFFLLAALLDLTEQWVIRESSYGRSALLGLVAGLIVLTRHPNAIFLAIIPLYGVTGRATFRVAVNRLVGRWRELALAATVALLVLLPQLAMYYQATGRLLVNSYGDLGFHFTSPRLVGILFGVEKGLFFWWPVLMLAVVGFFVGHPATRPFALGAAIVFVVDTYLIASWWDWAFGASYGHRGFVDLLPLFGLGLAAFFAWSTAWATRRWLVTLAATALVSLSTFQMLQYWTGVMPMSGVTWEQYRAVFLRLP